MVIEVKPFKEDSADIEYVTAKVFFKTLELLGGIKKLAEYRTLTWLPSLARASYVIVLKEEFFKTDEEIARLVGLTKNTVRNILRADTEVAMKKIKELEEISEIRRDLKVHTAGAIAKLAYKEIKEGNDCNLLLRYASGIAEETARILDVPWAYSVLKALKGIKYPIKSKEELVEHLKSLTLKGIPATEVLSKLTYPISGPAVLLHEIKKVLTTEYKED